MTILPFLLRAAADPARVASGRADIAGPIQAPGADKPSLRQSDIFVTASARSDNPPADSFSKTAILARELSVLHQACSEDAPGPLGRPTLPDARDSPTELFPAAFQRDRTVRHRSCDRF